MQNFHDILVRDILCLDDDRFFRIAQKLLNNGSTIDIADDEIWMNILELNFFSLPIFIKNSRQTRQNTRMLTPEKMFTIGKKRAVREIRRLDDKSRIDDIDLAMRIHRTHLLVRFDGKIGISREKISDLLESILKLLEFFILHDKLNIRSFVQQILENRFDPFLSKFIGLDFKIVLGSSDNRLPNLQASRRCPHFSGDILKIAQIFLYFSSRVVRCTRDSFAKREFHIAKI